MADLNKIVRNGAFAGAYDKDVHCYMPAVHYVRCTQNRAVASRRYTYANPTTRRPVPSGTLVIGSADRASPTSASRPPPPTRTSIASPMASRTTHTPMACMSAASWSTSPTCAPRCGRPSSHGERHVFSHHPPNAFLAPEVPGVYRQRRRQLAENHQDRGQVGPRVLQLLKLQAANTPPQDGILSVVY